MQRPWGAARAACHQVACCVSHDMTQAWVHVGSGVLETAAATQRAPPQGGPVCPQRCRGRCRATHGGDVSARTADGH
jgi:hypothetical protein